MREIKFRTWNSYDKVMDYDPGYDADWERVGINSALKPSAAFTFMQFTGSKDKNGVEIYEGDIICYFGKTDAMHFGTCTSEVRWNNQYRCGFFPMTSWYSQEGRDILEVIGNIHENPELLGVKQ